MVDEMDARCAELMAADGVAPSEVTIHYFADMCYAGQSFTLEVPFAVDISDPLGELVANSAPLTRESMATIPVASCESSICARFTRHSVATTWRITRKRLGRAL